MGKKTTFDFEDFEITITDKPRYDKNRRRITDEDGYLKPSVIEDEDGNLYIPDDKYETWENVILGIFIGGWINILSLLFLWGGFELSKTTYKQMIDSFDIVLLFLVGGTSLFLLFIGLTSFLCGFLGLWGGSLYIILYKIGIVKEWTPFSEDGNLKIFNYIKNIFKPKKPIG
tara:strand:+ start:2661 stop:3176 length:516 start_codon:yes stop_codon:yes gene_type:complete